MEDLHVAVHPHVYLWGDAAVVPWYIAWLRTERGITTQLFHSSPNIIDFTDIVVHIRFLIIPPHFYFLKKEVDNVFAH